MKSNSSGVYPRFPYNKLAGTIPGLGSCSSSGASELEGSLGKLGLPSLADWTAFLSVSHSKAEEDLAQLALSDPEQRELYEAARQVQSTFRKYKVGLWMSPKPLCVLRNIVPLCSSLWSTVLSPLFWCWLLVLAFCHVEVVSFFLVLQTWRFTKASLLTP